MQLLSPCLWVSLPPSDTDIPACTEQRVAPVPPLQSATGQPPPYLLGFPPLPDKVCQGGTPRTRFPAPPLSGTAPLLFPHPFLPGGLPDKTSQAHTGRKYFPHLQPFPTTLRPDAHLLSWYPARISLTHTGRSHFPVLRPVASTGRPLPRLFPSRCPDTASAPDDTGFCRHGSALPEPENRKRHPENASPPVLPTSRFLFRPGTFSRAHNLHRDFPVRRMRDIGKMHVSDLFPRPVLLRTDWQEYTGHTYGFSQLHDPAREQQPHNPDLCQGRQDTFSQSGTADTSFFSLAVPFQQRERHLALSGTIPSLHPGLPPLQGHPHTSGPGHTWQAHFPALLPDETGAGLPENPGGLFYFRIDSCGPVCIAGSILLLRSFSLLPQKGQGHPVPVLIGAPQLPTCFLLLLELVRFLLLFLCLHLFLLIHLRFFLPPVHPGGLLPGSSPARMFPTKNGDRPALMPQRSPCS